MKTALLTLALLLALSLGLAVTSSARGAPAADAVRIDTVRVEVEADFDALDRRVTVEGAGFEGTAFGPFVHFERDDGTSVEAAAVILQDGNTVLAWPPPGTRGAVTVVVENPDRQRVTGTAWIP
jgi:hypothetical protein